MLMVPDLVDLNRRHPLMPGCGGSRVGRAGKLCGLSAQHLGRPRAGEKWLRRRGEERELCGQAAQPNN